MLAGLATVGSLDAQSAFSGQSKQAWQKTKASQLQVSRDEFCRLYQGAKRRLIENENAWTQAKRLDHLSQETTHMDIDSSINHYLQEKRLLIAQGNHDKVPSSTNGMSELDPEALAKQRLEAYRSDWIKRHSTGKGEAQGTDSAAANAAKEPAKVSSKPKIGLRVDLASLVLLTVYTGNLIATKVSTDHETDPADVEIAKPSDLGGMMTTGRSQWLSATAATAVPMNACDPAANEQLRAESSARTG